MTKRTTRTLIRGMVLALSLLTAMPWQAFADSLDGDVLDVDGTQTSFSVTALTGTPYSFDISLVITKSGAQHLGNSVTVSFSGALTAACGSTVAGTIPSSITTPANWSGSGSVANGTKTSATTTTISGTTVSIGSYTCTYRYTASAGSPQLAPSQQNFNVAFTVTAPPLDVTPPVITPTVSGAPGDSPWYTSDVDVSWTVTDSESTVTSASGCDPSSVSADTTGTPFTCTATSAGGTASGSVTVKRDGTPPTVTATPTGTLGANGWYTSDVTVSFSCSDGTSGIASCPSNVLLSSDGAGQSASGTAYDYAGNSATASATGIDIDETGPTVTGSTDPAPNGYGWNNTDVEVTFDCDDATSGVASCVGDTTLTGEGADQLVTGTATDTAGNTSSANVSISIDKTKPTISGSASPTPNGSGWNNTDVTVTFTCADALSGVDSCLGSTTLSSEGTGQSATGTATDKAGNSESATVSGIKIDKTAPSISGFTVGPLQVGAALTSSQTVTDALSGVVGPAYTLDSAPATNAPSAAGVYDLCLIATDNAGNSNTTCALLPVYDPSAGFVTGGGWIMSPAGAYAADASLTGKATFGFVSKYQKGASTPVGNTEFQFQAGKFNFSSSSYQWLVVSGAKAQYKGTGTVNGASGYGFLLTATDGQVSGGGGGVDKFRIKVWNTSTGATVYDNAPGSDDLDTSNVQTLGGGSIVIHK